ncbi:peptidoglycan-associated lipoprotein Pal [Sphingosinicella ginsenosidimutans]|uniref:Peptidoglycan-associated lipoprotein n=1 Tax=Allosphingosinicella ginsenosidimutans TaxID=1176539 RepID=A0A5C6TSB1_9SPHN|nr:peptidoglycan-associated lipoprotein Pal [Sphingosinicella ginsenosidimutans]TXC63099.1 peptidoglycan-associated lipoprotein Pal [Sphingosinicella ginsenosidimutans]
MTMKMTSLALIAAVALTAGCAHQRRDQLPPAPPSDMNPGDQGNGMDQGNVGNAAVPGSRADFLQSVTSDRVFFDTDSYSVDDRARAVLDAQAQWLNRNPNVRVTIEGHADERGTREYNLALGDRRANAVRDYLQSRGVSPARMQTISWGKERPAVDGHDESAWAQNRRAVTVVPE